MGDKDIGPASPVGSSESTADIRVGEMPIDADLFHAQADPDPVRNRLEVKCNCGHTMNMPITAIGMTMACMKCGAKTTIDRQTAAPLEKNPLKARISAATPAVKPYHIQRLAEKRLGELLVEEEVVNETQLEEALAVQKGQGGKVGEVLISLGYVDLPRFVTFMAKLPGVTSIDLSNYNVPQEVASLITEDFAREHEVFPIDKLGQLLTVVMACPLDFATIEKVEAMTGLRVKPVLCTAEKIQAAIRKYLLPPDTQWVQLDDLLPKEEVRGLELPVAKESISSQIQQIDLLPLLPGTIHLVNRVVHDETSCSADLADVVKMDPPLAAKLLSMANARRYGMPGRVMTVEKAVSLIGMHETCTMVLNAAANGLFTDWRHFDYQSFWTKALCCATAASLVARAAGLSDAAQAYTAGLLHNIGQIALHQVAPGCYALVEKESSQEDPAATEERIAGMSHTNAGYVLAVAWGLPVSVAEAIRCHHQPEQAASAKETVAAIAIANALIQADEPGAEANEHLLDGCDTPLSLLGMDRRTALSLLDDYFPALERLFMSEGSSQNVEETNQRSTGES